MIVLLLHVSIILILCIICDIRFCKYLLASLILCCFITVCFLIFLQKYFVFVDIYTHMHVHILYAYACEKEGVVMCSQNNDDK